MQRLSRILGELAWVSALLAATACGGASPAPEATPSAAPTLAATPPPTAPPASQAAPPPTAALSPGATTPKPPKPTAEPTTPSTPTTLASAAPAATAPPVDHAKVASLVAEGEAALSQGKLDQAASLFGTALALDPDDTGARKGKALAATTLLGLTRTLVPDISSSEGAEGKIKQMDGFEDVEELNVKRAVRVPGRTELDSTTAHLKPGERYTVSVYLRNQSKKKKKNIKVSNANVHRIVNEKDSTLSVAWNPIEVLPNQRGLVATIEGTWEDDVASWVLNVRLLSENGDIYENQLVWK